VWYANLPAEALRWFDWLQAVFSGAGLTGLVIFALHFPRDPVVGWRRRVEPWLFLPFAALTGLSLWSFRNFTAGRREGAGIRCLLLPNLGRLPGGLRPVRSHLRHPTRGPFSLGDANLVDASGGA
jgi:hypothetical protein